MHRSFRLLCAPFLVLLRFFLRVGGVLLSLGQQHRECSFLLFDHRLLHVHQTFDAFGAQPVNNRCEQINRSHTHTHRQRTKSPTPTHTHGKNNTPNPQTNTPHKHLTTLEGGATTVRATSHARVGAQSVNNRCEQHRRAGA